MNLTHTPTLLDAAADLKRCIYASFSDQGFRDPNVITFLSHAHKVIDSWEAQLDAKLLAQIRMRLQKAQSPELSDKKRREDLLTAALLLQNTPTPSV